MTPLLDRWYVSFPVAAAICYAVLWSLGWLP